MAKRQRPNRIGAYVPVIKSIMRTPAWRAMSPGARLLWIELRGWLRNDFSNNGRMFLSCRDAAKAMGCNKDTVFRQYAENEHFGFLRQTSGGCLGSDGYGFAAHYRFTDIPYGTQPATRDFEEWDGKFFAYQPRRPARKKQKPVLSVRTPRPNRSDIGNSPDTGSLCPVRSDIKSASNCPVRSDTTSLPLPYAGEEQGKRSLLQGSSTVRAPARAGDAGSSPAPVAKPDLTTMVLDTVGESKAAGGSSVSGAEQAYREVLVLSRHTERFSYACNVCQEPDAPRIRSCPR